MVGHRPFPPDLTACDATMAGMSGEEAINLNTMYIVYVLKSQKDGTRYIGVTSKDVNTRTKEHNNNKSKFTRGHQPWKLVYTEVYENKKESYIRESFLKSGQGRKWLDNKLK